MLQFSLRLAPPKVCRGGISVNALILSLFLLSYSKPKNEFHCFISCPRAGTCSSGAVNLTQTCVSIVVNLFLCLTATEVSLLGVKWFLGWQSYPLPGFSSSLSCLEQVNSPPSLLLVLPTSACAHLTAEEQHRHKPSKGNCPKLGAMRLSASISSPSWAKCSVNWVSKASHCRGGEGRMLSTPRVHRASSQWFQTTPLPVGKEWNLSLHQLGVMGKWGKSSHPGSAGSQMMWS